MNKKMILILCGVLVLLGAVWGIGRLYVSYAPPTQYRNILGMIEPPEQVARNFLIACRNGDTEVICQYLTDDVRIRFFHTAVLAGEDPEHAIRRLAEKMKFRLRNAEFLPEPESAAFETPDKMSIAVRISYAEQRPEEKITLNLIRNRNGIWHCSTLPRF